MPTSHGRRPAKIEKCRFLVSSNYIAPSLEHWLWFHFKLLSIGSYTFKLQWNSDRGLLFSRRVNVCLPSSLLIESSTGSPESMGSSKRSTKLGFTSPSCKISLSTFALQQNRICCTSRRKEIIFPFILLFHYLTNYLLSDLMKQRCVQNILLQTYVHLSA